jgi:hypothetical protein
MIGVIYIVVIAHECALSLCPALMTQDSSLSLQFLSTGGQREFMWNILNLKSSILNSCSAELNMSVSIPELPLQNMRERVSTSAGGVPILRQEKLNEIKRGVFGNGTPPSCPERPLQVLNFR